jgi:hypothetical protein
MGSQPLLVPGKRNERCACIWQVPLFSPREQRQHRASLAVSIRTRDDEGAFREAFAVEPRLAAPAAIAGGTERSRCARCWLPNGLYGRA